jgi:hypothetical protein
MALQIKPKTTKIDYVRAPWHLRVRWWFAARLAAWGQGFAAQSAGAPELANPLWKR